MDKDDDQGNGSNLGKRTRKAKKQMNDHLEINFLDII
jgi:hypothetical protein